MLIQVPLEGGNTMPLELKAGQSTVFIGANGSGKSRLAAFIETAVGPLAHRIGAHRSVSINPTIAKIGFLEAISRLRIGDHWEGIPQNRRNISRWHDAPTASLLNDSDHVIQALFADQANVSLRTHHSARSGVLDLESVPSTHFEIITEIWNRLNSHRRLIVSGDDIQVGFHGIGPWGTYSASEMSDGERSVVYMVGQILLAPPDSVFIVDEPELHIHRAVISKLWDELEALRKDCSIVYVTHDLEFAASRVAQKFVIRSHVRYPRETWQLEEITASEFPEELQTLILGSRRPILFVEGLAGSLDSAVYRCMYPGWTIVACESCAHVVHAVATMSRHAQLTRIRCAGLVDADDYSDDEIEALRRIGVHALPVSEIENLFAHPDVARAICEADACEPDEAALRVEALSAAVKEHAGRESNLKDAVQTFCLRYVDRKLKGMPVNAENTVAEIKAAFADVQAIDIEAVANQRLAKIAQARRDNDMPTLLKLYSNKGLMALAASKLRKQRVEELEAWLGRSLAGGKAPGVVAALRALLPALDA